MLCFWAAERCDAYFSNTRPDGAHSYNNTLAKGSTLFPYRMSYSNPVRRTYGLTVRTRF